MTTTPLHPALAALSVEDLIRVTCDADRHTGARYIVTVEQMEALTAGEPSSSDAMHWDLTSAEMRATRDRIIDADHGVPRRVNGGWTVGDMRDLAEDIDRAERLAEVTR